MHVNDKQNSFSAVWSLESLEKNKLSIRYLHSITFADNLQTWDTSCSWKHKRFKKTKRKQFTDVSTTLWRLVTLLALREGAHNMRQFRELQTSFSFG